MYLLKLSLRPWRTAPYSQLFSALAVGFLLFLVGFLFWMQQGLKPVLVRLRNEQVITAYLNPAVQPKEASQIVDTIRTSLGAQASEIEVVDSPAFLAKLKPQYPDLVRELEELGNEISGIVPRYISVSGMMPDDALDSVKSIPGVELAESSKDRYHQVLGAFLALRWVARVLALGICFALLTGLIHLARMNSYLYSETLNFLKLWGAGTFELSAPSVFSGLSVGVLGGAVAATGWLVVGEWLARHVRTLSPLLHDMPEGSRSIALILLLWGALLGAFAGSLGSVNGSSRSA